MYYFINNILFDNKNYKLGGLWNKNQEKYKRYIRKQIKKESQTQIKELEQEISKTIGTNLLKALDDIS